MSNNHESMIVRVNRYMKQSTAMVCGSFSFSRKEEPKTTFTKKNTNNKVDISINTSKFDSSWIKSSTYSLKKNSKSKLIHIQNLIPKNDVEVPSSRMSSIKTTYKLKSRRELKMKSTIT
ncbi:hypothetical protein YC2023_043810 [Brassica napus]